MIQKRNPLSDEQVEGDALKSNKSQVMKEYFADRIWIETFVKNRKAYSKDPCPLFVFPPFKSTMDVGLVKDKLGWYAPNVNQMNLSQGSNHIVRW